MSMILLPAALLAVILSHGHACTVCCAMRELQIEHVLDLVSMDHRVPSQSSTTYCKDRFPLALLCAQPADFVSCFVLLCKALYCALH